MQSLMATKPNWYQETPVERQGLWAAGASKWALGQETSYGERTRLVLKDGTVLDGVLGETRNLWDPKHSVALRIPGRKTQKWVAVRDIAVAWGDKGRPTIELLAEYIERGRE